MKIVKIFKTVYLMLFPWKYGENGLTRVHAITGKKQKLIKNPYADGVLDPASIWVNED